MNPEVGARLPAVARQSIAEALGVEAADALDGIDVDATGLSRPGASFVTLTQSGELRGCIGSLEARRPLIDDVRANAVAAALDDPRFPPLSAAELPETRIEVSVLSPPRPLDVRSEEEAIERLVPGRDGVILEYGRHRATFLPQVWDQLPDARTFLAHLRLKAGLPAMFWDPAIRLRCYSVEKFGDPVGRGRR